MMKNITPKKYRIASKVLLLLLLSALALSSCGKKKDENVTDSPSPSPPITDTEAESEQTETPTIEPTAEPTPTPEPVRLMVVTEDRVRFRDAPSTDSTTINYLPKGKVVTFVEDNDKWIKVKIDDVSGYVSKDFLRESSANSNTETITMVVSENSVRFRDAASTSSNIIQQLAKGTKVELISSEGDWGFVKYGTKEGYISMQFLKVEP